MAFDVLFVCTGNICRSPMAERLFLTKVAGGSPVRAGSAGTSGLAGYAMDLPSAVVLRELGGDPDGHVARRLTSAMVESAHLVLTAESEHRAAVLQLAPMAFRRTFTLREFARLGASAGAATPGPGAEQLRARVAEIAAQRGSALPTGPGQDDIGDPFGAALDVVRRCGAQIDDSIGAVVTALGLQPGPDRQP